MNYSALQIWIIIASIGAGSWALRFSFLGLLGDKPLPEWVLRHLRYTAVAIIPGLVAPMIAFPTATGGQTDPVRLTAALITLGVGVTTRNIFAAILAGVITMAVGLGLFT